MLYIDEKFVQSLAPLLRNFRKKKNHHYNFSCPCCGDSQKNKTKARGYLYPNKGRIGLVYKCHNCGISMSFANLLKRSYPEVYNEYVLERYKGNVTGQKQRHNKIEDMVGQPIFKKKKELAGLTTISSLAEDHFARKYIVERKIPSEFYDQIYFTEDFSSFITSAFPGRYQNLPENDQRIVLLFKDKEDNIVGAQGRALFQTKMRYVTARANDGVRLVYGIESHNRAQRTYVVEGPFDSLFLPNALAVATSDLLGIESRMGQISKAVFVFDNEPRNKQIVELMNKAIELNKTVCIWPDSIKEKDINDMILSGKTKEEVQKIIDDNLVSGIEAQLKFNMWKKC